MISLLPRIPIEGNLAHDPELRFSANGKALVTFTVVAGDRRRNDAGNWEDVDTSFFRCTAFGQMAENVANSLAKGQKVTVLGKIKERSWQDNEGQTRRAWEVTCDDVALSLRWDEARSSRVQRNQGQPAQDPWASTQQPPADPWAAFQGQDDDPPF